MSKKHILTVSALALAALILIGVFAYCLPLMISEGEERQEDKSEDEIVFERADESEEKTQTERATYDPFFDPTREVIPIEDVDFEDEEISILYNDHVLSAREWHKLIPEDELDEAVARRNEEVQEALGVNVVWHPIAYNGSYYSEFSARFFDLVSSYINSGIHMYDIASNFADCTSSPVIRDYTINLLDEMIFPYFDFTLPCWNQSLVKNTTANDQLFYICGDINLSVFDSSTVVWHNKTLYDRYKELDDPNNLQTYALYGFWTYEQLYRWSSFSISDAAGDICGISMGREGDTAIANPGAVTDSIIYAWDLDFVVRNQDGTHSFDMRKNEKAETALIMYRSILNAEGRANASAARFANGRAMFYIDGLYTSYNDNDLIRTMEDFYTLLPMPKYDEKQETYLTAPQDYFGLMFVLDHSESKVHIKGDPVSAFLQLSAEKSYDVRGYYFNRVVKSKYFGTDDADRSQANSLRLFNIIVENIQFDYCNVYCQQLKSVASLWRDACYSDTEQTLGDLYALERESFEESIIDMDTWLGLRECRD